MNADVGLNAISNELFAFKWHVIRDKSKMEIYVGNIPYQTDSEILHEIFSDYGQVNNVKIVVNHDTGKPRGYAFVIMNNDEEAKQAIEALDGSDIGGRPAKVNQSRPREQKNSGGNNNRFFRKKRFKQ